MLITGARLVGKTFIIREFGKQYESFVKINFWQSRTKKEQQKRSGKRYNKEVKKQLTMSLISDELGQASTKKKEFLGIMEKLIPWSQWVGIVQPHYYKGECGNKPYDLELMLRIYVLQHLYNLADDAVRKEQRRMFMVKTGIWVQKRRMMRFLSTTKNILSGIKSTSVRRS